MVFIFPRVFDEFHAEVFNTATQRLPRSAASGGPSGPRTPMTGGCAPFDPPPATLTGAACLRLWATIRPIRLRQVPLRLIARLKTPIFGVSVFRLL